MMRQTAVDIMTAQYSVDDARRVAGQLDIPYYVMNFKNEFKKKM